MGKVQDGLLPLDRVNLAVNSKKETKGRVHFVFCSPKDTIMKIRSISDLYYAIPATVS